MWAAALLLPYPAMWAHRSRSPFLLGYSPGYLTLLLAYALVCAALLFVAVYPGRLGQLVGGKWGWRTVGMALRISIALFMGEAALHVIPPAYWLRGVVGVNDNVNEPHPTLNHTMRANLQTRSTSPFGEYDVPIHSNSQGFRDLERTAEKPSGVRRIVLLGDSMLAALQVEFDEIFPRLLEQRLNAEQAASRWEVVNLGIGSYSPILEYLLLKEKGLAYRPDVVLLEFFPRDVHETMLVYPYCRLDETKLPTVCPPTQQPRPYTTFQKLRDVVVGPSFFFLLVSERIDALRSAGPSRDVWIWDRATPEHDRAWAVTLRMIRGAADLARSHGSAFGLMAFPVGNQVRLDEYPWATQQGIPSDPGPQSILRDFCADNGIPFLDLLPSMQRAEESPLFFPYDGHLTPKGHRLVTRELEGFVQAVARR